VANTYPNPQDVTFLVAEDIRQEASNKISFIGAYTGRSLQIPASGPSQHVAGVTLTLPQLAFYFGLRGGKGVYSARPELIGPDNVNLTPGLQAQQAAKPIETLVLDIMFKVAPFPLKLGTYRARVFLDDKVYEQTFSVVDVAVTPNPSDGADPSRQPSKEAGISAALQEDMPYPGVIKIPKK